MSKRLTTEEFIDKSNKAHLGKNVESNYDYSKAKYIDNKTKIIIICKKYGHGEFIQIPSDHINGHGCPKCSGRLKYTKEEFIIRSQSIHKDEFENPRYDYSKVVYINNKTKVKIICNKHGIFEQKPESHTNQKNGCPKCSRVAIPTTIEFVEKCKQIHKNEYGQPKYDYSKTVYTNAFSKVAIICSNHGEFLQVANYHLRGNGCPTCKDSKGEMKILSFLTQQKINKIRNKRFSDCKHKYELPFDFYLPDHNICIEYDGEFHYNLSKFRDNEIKLSNMQRNDKIKDKYCKDNNIYLIRIPYWNFDKIDDILKQELKTITQI